MTHSLICCAALVTLVFAFPAPGQDKPQGEVPKVSVEEFDQMRKTDRAVVLDVRTPEEFNAGHVPGAVNLDVNSPDFDKKLESLDKNKTYLLHCQRGGRSARAAEKMQPSVGNLFDITAWMI